MFSEPSVILFMEGEGVYDVTSCLVPCSFWEYDVTSCLDPCFFWRVCDQSMICLQREAVCTRGWGWGGWIWSLVMTSSGDNCSSRYASYWNAFLLYIFVILFSGQFLGADVHGSELQTGTKTENSNGFSCHQIIILPLLNGERLEYTYRNFRTSKIALFRACLIFSWNLVH